MEREDLLTLKEASEMVLYSLGWLRLPCGDHDSPRMFYVYDRRRKFMLRDDFIEYCEQHNIEIVRNV